MMLKGRYYMHERSSSMCALILDVLGNNMFEVQWWEIGQVGTPHALGIENEQIYMHPDVWRDITEFLQEPREQWS
jgi:hypothetical protein